MVVRFASFRVWLLWIRGILNICPRYLVCMISHCFNVLRFEVIVDICPYSRIGRTYILNMRTMVLFEGPYLVS